MEEFVPTEPNGRAACIAAATEQKVHGCLVPKKIVPKKSVPKKIVPKKIVPKREIALRPLFFE